MKTLILSAIAALSVFSAASAEPFIDKQRDGESDACYLSRVVVYGMGKELAKLGDAAKADPENLEKKAAVRAALDLVSVNIRWGLDHCYDD